MSDANPPQQKNLTTGLLILMETDKQKDSCPCWLLPWLIVLGINKHKICDDDEFIFYNKESLVPL